MITRYVVLYNVRLTSEHTGEAVSKRHINRVFAKVRFSKCTSQKIVPKAVFAVHFLKKGKNVLYRR